MNIKCEMCLFRKIKGKKLFCSKNKIKKYFLIKNDDVYIHKFDYCKEFYPDFNHINGFYEILYTIDNDWYEKVLKYIVYMGILKKIFTKKKASVIIKKVEKDVEFVNSLLKKTEEKPEEKKSKLKRRKRK